MKRDRLFRGRQRTFGTVLALLAAAAIFQLAAPDADWARFVAIVLQGATVVAALGAAGAVGGVLTFASVAYLALVAVSAIALLGPSSVADGGPRLTALLLVLLTPASIVIGLLRILRRDRAVTLQVVYGALCLYLLLGLGFSFSFGLVQDFDGDPFFAGGEEGSSNSFLYFSLTTLTTTGYGDLTAAGDTGRALAVTEALIGQIYLVTVIAMLVSNLLPPRRVRPDR